MRYKFFSVISMVCLVLSLSGMNRASRIPGSLTQVQRVRQVTQQPARVLSGISAAKPVEKAQTDFTRSENKNESKWGPLYGAAAGTAVGVGAALGYNALKAPEKEPVPIQEGLAERLTLLQKKIEGNDKAHEVIQTIIKNKTQKKKILGSTTVGWWQNLLSMIEKNQIELSGQELLDLWAISLFHMQDPLHKVEFMDKVGFKALNSAKKLLKNEGKNNDEADAKLIQWLVAFPGWVVWSDSRLNKDRYSVFAVKIFYPFMIPALAKIIHNPLYQKVIADYLKTSDKDTLNAFIKKYPDAVSDLGLSEHAHMSHMLLIEQNKKIRDQVQKAFEGTLSEIHFEQALPERKESLLSVVPLSALKQFQEGLNLESQLLNKHYISFYHAQNTQYALANDISNTLFYTLLGEPQHKEFCFAVIRPQDLKRASLMPQSVMRGHHILMQGPVGQDRPDALALNLFGFGNSFYSGSTSSSLDLLMRNSTYNATRPTGFYTLLETLKVLGLPQKSLNRILPLMEQAALLGLKTYSTGRLLVIAVPENSVDDQVYTVRYHNIARTNSYDRRVPITLAQQKIYHMSEAIKTIRGQKDTGVTQEPILEGGFDIVHDLYAVIQALQRQEKPKQEKPKIDLNDLDTFECAIPLSQAGLLNPYSGIKVFAIDGQPSSVGAKIALDRAKQALMDAIIKEFKDTKTLEKAKQVIKNYDTMLKDVANARISS